MAADSLLTAIDSLRHAVRLHPTHPCYRALLGEATLLSGNVDEAVMHLVRALDGKTPPRVHHLLGVAFLARRQWALAEKMTTQALELNATIHAAHYARARARHEMGNVGGALQDLDQAMMLNATCEEYHLAHARVLASHQGKLGAHGAARGRALVLLAELEGRGDADHEIPVLRSVLDRRRARAGSPAGSERRAPASRATAVLEAPPEPPSWPDLWDASVPVIPRRFLLRWDGDGDLPEDDGHDTAWELFLEFGAPRGRTRARLDVSDLLQRGRRALEAEQAAKAADWFEQAWSLLESAGPLRDGCDRRLRQAVAEGLAVVFTRLPERKSTVGPLELYHAGARFGAFLQELSRSLLLADRRTDEAAREIYVAALENDAIDDSELRWKILATLSRLLAIDLDDDPLRAQAHLPLLERLHRWRPGLAFPLLYLGHYHYLLQRYERACEFLDRVAGNLANQPRVLALRAACEQKQGRTAQARRLYRDALSISDTHPDVHFALGRLLLSTT